MGRVLHQGLAVSGGGREIRRQSYKRTARIGFLYQKAQWTVAESVEPNKQGLNHSSALDPCMTVGKFPVGASVSWKCACWNDKKG